MRPANAPIAIAILSILRRIPASPFYIFSHIIANFHIFAINDCAASVVLLDSLPVATARKNQGHTNHTNADILPSRTCTRAY